MQIIIELEASNGKTITEKIKAKSIEIGKSITSRKYKHCTILDSYEDRKQSRKCMMKDCW